MIKRFIRWFVSPSKKQIVEDIDLYTKIAELEDRIGKLEDENVEISNCIYELTNNINSVDARIDIVASENLNNNVR